MIDITLDFETYFDTKVSLTKLTTMEYIKHPMFKVWGVGIKYGDNETEWFSEMRSSTNSNLLTGVKYASFVTTLRSTHTYYRSTTVMYPHTLWTQQLCHAANTPANQPSCRHSYTLVPQ